MSAPAVIGKLQLASLRDSVATFTHSKVSHTSPISIPGKCVRAFGTIPSRTSCASDKSDTSYWYYTGMYYFTKIPVG